MAYTKTVWTDRQVTNPLRFSFTLISGTAGTTGSVYDLIPNEGTISTAGTPINASNLNNIENGIFNLDAQVTTNTSNIATLTSGKVAKNGDTMTGALTNTVSISTPTLTSTGTLSVSGTSTLSAVTCTQLNATGAGGLQENGVQLSSKYLALSGGTMTGQLVTNNMSNPIHMKGNASGATNVVNITGHDSGDVRQFVLGKLTSGTSDVTLQADLGDLVLTTATGTVKVNDDLTVSGTTSLSGALTVVGTSITPLIMDTSTNNGRFRFTTSASANFLQSGDTSNNPKNFVIGGALGTVVGEMNLATNVLRINSQPLQSGMVAIVPVANTPTKVTVTFPTAYSSPPHVVACGESAVIGSQLQGVSVANITNTTVDIYLYRTNTNSTNVHWIAMG